MLSTKVKSRIFFLILSLISAAAIIFFIFTFLSCFFLYLRTKKEFQKQEKMYINEFKQLQTVKTKKATREILSGSSI